MMATLAPWIAAAIIFAVFAYMRRSMLRDL